MSALGIPQIAVVHGISVAGMFCHPIVLLGWYSQIKGQVVLMFQLWQTKI
jgi:hypothetical protein